MGILFTLLGIIIFILIVALFVEKDYRIQREIVINRPKSQVFSYLKFLQNQDNFSKWVMVDPAMRKTFKGIDGTVGAAYAWEGNKKAGKGEQEIKKITEGERIDIEIRFEKPMKSVAQVAFVTTTVTENQTKVAWVMNGRSEYPMNIMTAVMKGILGKDMETSLQTLKTILER